MNNVRALFQIPEHLDTEEEWTHIEGECECDICELKRKKASDELFARCKEMGLAPKYHCLRMDHYWTDLPGQQNAMSHARDFLDGKYRTLIFSGAKSEPGYGTGKTTLAAIILYQASIVHRKSGLYSLASRLFTELKDAIDCKSGTTQRIKNRFIRSPLLVIDEIGTEPLSVYDKKILSDILAERIEFGRQTIIISNKDWDTLKANLHPRVIDRMNESSRGVVFDWPSARRRGA